MDEKLDYIINQNKYIMEQNDAIMIMMQGFMLKEGFSEEELERLRKHTEREVKKIYGIIGRKVELEWEKEN